MMGEPRWTTRRLLVQRAVAEVVTIVGAWVHPEPATWLFTLVPVLAAAGYVATRSRRPAAVARSTAHRRTPTPTLLGMLAVAELLMVLGAWIHPAPAAWLMSLAPPVAAVVIVVARGRQT